MYRNTMQWKEAFTALMTFDSTVQGRRSSSSAGALQGVTRWPQAGAPI